MPENTSRAVIGRCPCSARELTICGKNISDTLAYCSCALLFKNRSCTDDVKMWQEQKSGNMESDCLRYTKQTLRGF